MKYFQNRTYSMYIIPFYCIVSVVNQKYKVQVHDEYVMSGNTAVLKCQVRYSWKPFFGYVPKLCMPLMVQKIYSLDCEGRRHVPYQQKQFNGFKAGENSRQENWCHFPVNYYFQFHFHFHFHFYYKVANLLVTNVAKSKEKCVKLKEKECKQINIFHLLRFKEVVVHEDNACVCVRV